MAIIKAARPGGSLKRLIQYVTRREKTDERLLAGVQCDPQNAYDDMMITKEMFHKTGGRQYKHFIYSFPPGEKITPEQVRDNALKLITETPALEGYQALIAVHRDRKHIHAHIVVNSVNWNRGKKLQWNKSDLSNLKERCNALSQSQGLSVPEKGNVLSAWDKDKYQTLKKGEKKKAQSWYMAIANEVIQAQRISTSRQEFMQALKEKGITTYWSDKRKYITFEDKDGHKVRNNNLEKTLKIPCSKDALNDQFKYNSRQSVDKTWTGSQTTVCANEATSTANKNHPGVHRAPQIMDGLSNLAHAVGSQLTTPQGRLGTQGVKDGEPAPRFTGDLEKYKRELAKKELERSQDEWAMGMRQSFGGSAPMIDSQENTPDTPKRPVSAPYSQAASPTNETVVPKPQRESNRHYIKNRKRGDSRDRSRGIRR